MAVAASSDNRFIQMARPLSFYSTKASRRFLIAAFWLLSAPAFAQTADVTLKLTPAEVVAIVRSMDRQPISQIPPPGFWSLQIKINRALAADPVAKRAVQSAFESAGKHGR